MIFRNIKENRIFAYWELSSMMFDHTIYNPNLMPVPNSHLKIVYLYIVLLIFILLDLLYYYNDYSDDYKECSKKL